MVDLVVPSAGYGPTTEQGMRVVLDGRYISDGFPGIARYTYNLAHALGSLDGGCHLSVLVNRHLPNTRFDLDRLGSLPNCQIVDCSVQRSLPSELLRLRGVVTRLRPALFHSPFFLRPYPLRARCVVSLYDLIPLHPSFKAVGRFDRIVFRLGAKLACRTSAAVITATSAVARAIVEWSPQVAERLHVVPLAPDPRFRPQPPLEIERVVQKLALRRPYVLHVGSHSPHKNIDTLIEAWLQLDRTSSGDLEPFELVLAGATDVDGGGPARAMCPGSERGVRYLGPVEEADLPALYSGAELLVFPSRIEGFGFPVVEAMACGTAVVCSRDPALSEVVGDTAWKIDPDEPRAMAAVIQRALGNQQQRRELAERGRARVCHLSWNEVAEATLWVYRKAAGRA